MKLPRLSHISFALAVAISLPPLAAAQDVAVAKQPAHVDDMSLATKKPVQVYILSGQSNMVGIGQISGGSQRWSDITAATVSVYSGEYSPDVDYDKMNPIKTKALPVYGGVKPTPFPGGGVQVARGFIEIKTSGVYKFTAGYSNSTFNIMEIDGVEVYRRQVGEDAKHTRFKITAGKKYGFKITFLTAAANGLGWWQRTDIPGTLETLVNADGKFSHLVDDDGKWTVQNDVWYKGLVTAGANKWLSVGCGASSNQIGPELGFGHVMGRYHDQPVLIIKTSQGNRSLGWDFLPPGSERFTHEGTTYAGYQDTPSSWVDGEPKKKVNWYAGKQYDDCFAAAHKVLNDFASEFPQFKDRGYEIAGFVWWQGHKDGGSAVHADRYEQNLVRLIKTLRKEFKAPNAPFVIATIGFGGWKMAGNHLNIANSQLAVSGNRGNKGKYPEFAGNVLTVETRDFWREASISPRNQDFHYNGNAETYMLVGDALARAMVEMVEKGE
jgi:alpha-galactosidase